MSGRVAGRTASPRLRFAMQARAAALALGASVLLFGQAASANTEDDVINGQTDLTLATTYAGGLPTAASDVTFTNTAYSPAAFTLGSALTIGTLDDLSTTALTISGAGTLTLSGGANSVAPNPADLLYVVSGGSLGISSNIALTTTAASGNFDIAGSSALSGVISGTGFGFTKTGAGTLTLSGTNTYTGGTTISAGTISLGNASGLGTGTAAIGASGTLTIAPPNSSDFQVNNALTGTGMLNITGTAQTKLTGTLSGFTGTLNVQTTGGGKLNVSNNNTLGSGVIVNVSSGSTLFTSGSGIVLAGDTINLNGTGNSENLGAFRLDGGSSVAASSTINLQSNSSIGGTGTGTVNGVIGGAFSLTKQGAGTLVLNAANTYSGGTIISGGTIMLGSSTNASTPTSGPLGTGTVRNDANTIDLNGQTLSNVLTNTTGFSNGTFTNSSSATATVSTGYNPTGASGVVLSDFTVNGTGNINWSGSINRTNSTGTVTKSGANTFTLSGAGANYSGMNYTVSAGTLAFALSGGTFASGSITDNAAVVGAEASGVTNTINSTIGGSGTFTQSGAGTTAFNANNNYTGGTTVNAGLLQLLVGNGPNGSLGGVVTINSGGTVQTKIADALGYAGGTGTVSTVNVNTGGVFDNGVNGNNGYATAFNLTGGSVTSSGGGSINFAASASVGLSSLASSTTAVFSAPITLRNSTSLAITTAAGTTASGVDLLISGAIGQNGGNYGITKAGPGLLVLTGTSSYGGATTISAGTLQVGDGTTNGTITSSSGITDNSALVFNYGTASSPSYGNAITGTGSVTKTGTGTLYFSGANSFSGGLQVQNGVLALSNSSTYLTSNGGTDTVTLGLAGAANNTVVSVTNNGRTFTNPITTVGTGGTNSIQTNGGGQTFTFSGNATLGNNLTLSTVNGTDAISYSGAIGGTGNLVTNVSTVGLGGNNTAGTTYGTGGTITVSGNVNNVGTVTNTGGGTAGTTISGIIGTNVTSVIQNSATDPLYLSGANTSTGTLQVQSGILALQNTATYLTSNGGTGTVTLGTSGAANNTVVSVTNVGRTFANSIVTTGTGGTNAFQTNGGGQTFTFSGPITLGNNLTFSTVNGTDAINVSGAVGGTGNLVTSVSTVGLGGNNTAGTTYGTGGTITLGGNVNNAGTVTNNGSGSAATTINGIIGTNVSSVVQNSATSGLVLTAANTYTGSTTVLAGMLSLTTGSINGSNSVSVANTGALTLGNATALSDNATLTMVSGSALNLNAANGTSEIINSLVLDGTSEPSGTYTASQLMGFDPSITFTSSLGETLTIAAVPEPSTWMAGLLGIGAVGYRLRRRMGWLSRKRPSAV